MDRCCYCRVVPRLPADVDKWIFRNVAIPLAASVKGGKKTAASSSSSFKHLVLVLICSRVTEVYGKTFLKDQVQDMVNRDLL